MKTLYPTNSAQQRARKISARFASMPIPAHLSRPTALAIESLAIDEAGREIASESRKCACCGATLRSDAKPFQVFCSRCAKRRKPKNCEIAAQREATRLQIEISCLRVRLIEATTERERGEMAERLDAARLDLLQTQFKMEVEKWKIQKPRAHGVGQF